MNAAAKAWIRRRQPLPIAVLAAAAAIGASTPPALAAASAAGSSGGASASRSLRDGGTLAPVADGGASAPGGASTSASPTEVQRRLVALRYLPSDAVSGRWDYRTAQAVTAFQAWQGLGRDGVVGRQTLAALRTASVPTPAHATRGRSIEVYRSKGVTLLVENLQVIRAIHSSSGRPGYTTRAGSYRVFRKEPRSWSYPYHSWLPYASYFNAGIAFHAYADVPAQPASHGCIRVSAPEAAFLYAFATIGTPVTVY